MAYIFFTRLFFSSDVYKNVESSFKVLFSFFSQKKKNEHHEKKTNSEIICIPNGDLSNDHSHSHDANGKSKKKILKTNKILCNLLWNTVIFFGHNRFAC